MKAERKASHTGLPRKGEPRVPLEQRLSALAADKVLDVGKLRGKIGARDVRRSEHPRGVAPLPLRGTKFANYEGRIVAVSMKAVKPVRMAHKVSVNSIVISLD